MLPFEDESFDAAIVTVSVQYLVRPVEVFAEVGRTLKRGCSFAVAYSNRMFPAKAVAIWQSIGHRERADLVALYFRLSGRFGPARAWTSAQGRARIRWSWFLLRRSRHDMEVLGRQFERPGALAPDPEHLVGAGRELDLQGRAAVRRV